MSAPTVSVVLPTYNRADVVATTIERLLAQDYPHHLLEVLVADNSSDDTPARVRALAAAADLPVTLVSSQERLPAVKRNQALRAATGDLMIFMNDDVWVRPDFIREHVAAHARHAGPVAVVGLVEQSALMPSDPFIEWYQPFAYAQIADRAGREVTYRHHWSMNLSLPRRVMLERNLVFHEDWAEIGHEDVELGYRWSKAGYPIVYEPRAWGEHFHPHGLDSACRLQESIGRGLRDLEVLIPEPDLLARYGVPTRSAPPTTRVRTAARVALFNSVTVPVVQRRLAALDRRSRLAEWTYWKVLLHYTRRGYRSAPARTPTPTPTWSPAGEP
ncbi:glycosyltransferase family 2 protein [Pengzhenrongella sicca]|uniref:Glycosyltransferase family 2 protein n=1 Tax=Pengzhenrongella sicca TaxID=2819238 RepID=A0A8A4ZBA4_9MICO|nr:glycosyltransferase family 2 protein [Pengzhenrongella sicca]QTE29270.1 glycosyltransferase family 2 protein [Pengzhenrongella sicca]